MNAQAKDRDGWPLRTGARCYRFTRDGFQLKEQVVITGFSSTAKHPIAVDVEGLSSGNKGTTLPSQLRVLVTAEGEDAPMSVQRFRARKRDSVLLAELKAQKKEARREKFVAGQREQKKAERAARKGS